MLPGKWQPFCHSFNVFNYDTWLMIECLFSATCSGATDTADVSYGVERRERCMEWGSGEVCGAKSVGVGGWGGGHKTWILGGGTWKKYRGKKGGRVGRKKLSRGRGVEPQGGGSRPHPCPPPHKCGCIVTEFYSKFHICGLILHARQELNQCQTSSLTW